MGEGIVVRLIDGKRFDDFEDKFAFGKVDFAVDFVGITVFDKGEIAEIGADIRDSATLSGMESFAIGFIRGGGAHQAFDFVERLQELGFDQSQAFFQAGDGGHVQGNNKRHERVEIVEFAQVLEDAKKLGIHLDSGRGVGKPDNQTGEPVR